MAGNYPSPQIGPVSSCDTGPPLRPTEGGIGTAVVGPRSRSGFEPRLSQPPFEKKCEYVIIISRQTFNCLNARVTTNVHMSKYPNVQTSKCFNVQMSRRPDVQMSKCATLGMSKSRNVQTATFQNVQMFQFSKCPNLEMFKWPHPKLFRYLNIEMSRSSNN